MNKHLSFSETPSEQLSLAILPNLPNISASHSQTEKNTKCMDSKWSPILVLSLAINIRQICQILLLSWSFGKKTQLNTYFTNVLLLQIGDANYQVNRKKNFKMIGMGTSKYNDRLSPSRICTPYLTER